MATQRATIRELLDVAETLEQAAFKDRDYTIRLATIRQPDVFIHANTIRTVHLPAVVEWANQLESGASSRPGPSSG